MQGKNRAQVAEAGRALGLDGKYIPFSYIEQACCIKTLANGHEQHHIVYQSKYHARTCTCGPANVSRLNAHNVQHLRQC